MKWCIFYDDGSVFTSMDGEAWEAPAVGVVVLNQIDSAGKNVLYCKDNYYCWGWRSPNEWVACDQTGYQDYMFHHRGPKAVLFGRWTDNRNFETIWQKADVMWRSNHGC